MDSVHTAFSIDLIADAPGALVLDLDIRQRWSAACPNGDVHRRGAALVFVRAFDSNRSICASDASQFVSEAQSFIGFDVRGADQRKPGQSAILNHCEHTL